MRATRLMLAMMAAPLALAACGDASGPPIDASTDSLIQSVRQLAVEKGITPLDPAPRVRPALVKLGQALAFDKVMSGNHDVSCMTCHLPQFATSDARSLSIGVGGTGLGPQRTGSEIARNAPSAFNLTAIKPLFWDGRVEQDDGGNYHTPAGVQLTPAMTSVFEFGTLSAQPLFPLLARTEMRGADGNELAAFPDSDNTGIWNAIMARLGAIPKYRQMFEDAYPGTDFDDMNIAYASNAIGAFLASDFSSNGSPWDRFLDGDDRAMSVTQLKGAQDFLKAKCSVCHNGPAFTDNKFHDVAVVQLGPGEGDGAGGTDDFGRMRVTGNPADKYAFRTSALRNVELTAPYGHDGAYTTLRMFVDHYSESDVKLRNFDPSALPAGLQASIQPTAEDILANRDTLLNGVVFTDQQIDEVTEFMKALTDPAARDLSRTVPSSVPSGLGID
jgi:cytochrome c peroxidase